MKVTDKITITNEDCMELLKRTPDNYYSLAICDPPYGIDAGKMTMGSGKHNFKKGKDWDSNIPSEEYFNELFRVSKNQIIWGGNYFPLELNNNWIIWDKLNPNLSFSEAELAWCSINNNTRIFKRLSTLPDIDGTKQHPTQKPVALYKWLLNMYAKEIKCDVCIGSGEIESLSLDCDVKTCNKCKGKGTIKPKILDTHLGSGSIAIACHDMGFELTGCELDSDYYTAGIERIKRHVSQLSLFEPEELIQTKQTLF